ncbi:MAG: AAA family ATPase [Coxiellaceae bacterium]|nr:AAA family ATPase [Coxiellaceae bacterium]
MDKINNPFCPDAGSPPPELAGRENIVEQASILLRRTKNKRPEKSLLLTGLRGVGKTVLLNEIEQIAKGENYRTLLVEAHSGKSLAALLAPQLRRLLFDLDRLSNAGNKTRRALNVLKSFVSAIKLKVGEIELGVDLEPAPGLADSGDLEVDLPDLFTAVAEAAQERECAVAILIDEIQYLTVPELSALIMAMHKMQQSVLPLVLIGAGLPILPALAGESKSYAERLFNFPIIGPLNKHAAIQALQEPVQVEGVSFNQSALNEIFNLTTGYPYFLQEWGYQAWNYAATTPIDKKVIKKASKTVLERLDKNFFRVRFDRSTPREKMFLRAMAELKSNNYRTGDIAAKLNVSINTLGPIRSNLIKKGMIYSPSYGEIAFTVPLFDEFMRRAIPTTNHIS